MPLRSFSCFVEMQDMITITSTIFLKGGMRFTSGIKNLNSGRLVPSWPQDYNSEFGLLSNEVSNFILLKLLTATP